MMLAAKEPRTAIWYFRWLAPSKTLAMRMCSSTGLSQRLMDSFWVWGGVRVSEARRVCRLGLRVAWTGRARDVIQRLCVARKRVQVVDVELTS